MVSIRGGFPFMRKILIELELEENNDGELEMLRIREQLAKGHLTGNNYTCGENYYLFTVEEYENLSTNLV